MSPGFEESLACVAADRKSDSSLPDSHVPPFKPVLPQATSRQSLPEPVEVSNDEPYRVAGGSMLLGADGADEARRSRQWSVSCKQLCIAEVATNGHENRGVVASAWVVDERAPTGRHSLMPRARLAVGPGCSKAPLDSPRWRPAACRSDSDQLSTFAGLSIGRRS